MAQTPGSVQSSFLKPSDRLELMRIRVSAPHGLGRLAAGCLLTRGRTTVALQPGCDCIATVLRLL